MNLCFVRNQLNMGISLNDINLRVTDYSRVSTDHDEQKKSLRNQIEHFREYIKSNENWIYVDGYVDNGISGTSDIKRDDFMRMMEDAKNGLFDLIVTKEISRFSRNTLDSIKYTRLLLSYGVAVYFVNDNINTLFPDSELRLTIMASMAQDEIRRLSERVKFGMMRAINRGEILGNDMLYGYKKNRNSGFLDIVLEEANIVRMIYEMYAVEELSLSKICRILNDMNFKTSFGNKWSVSTISRLIENPKYKGYYCGKKSEVIDYMTKKVEYLKKDNWIIYEDKERIPPIVNEDLWNIANKRLVSRKKAFAERNLSKDIYKNRYLYSAKIFCYDHNEVFHRRILKNNDVSWICSLYLKNGKSFCDSVIIKESELNDIFKDLMLNLNIDFSRVIDILMDCYKRFDLDFFYDDRILILEDKVKSFLGKKDKLLNLNLQGLISDEEFFSKNTLFDRKINDIKLEINELNNFNKNDWISYDNFDFISEYLNLKVKSDFMREKFINLVLDYIVVKKVSNNKNQIKLDVFLLYGECREEKLNKFYKFKRGVRENKSFFVIYDVDYYWL